MCLGLQAYSSTALLHSLHSILDLVDASLWAPCGDVAVVLAAVHCGGGWGDSGAVMKEAGEEGEEAC